MPFITLGMVPHFRVKIRSKQKGKSSVFENDVRHRGRNVKTPLHTAERTRKDLQRGRVIECSIWLTLSIQEKAFYPPSLHDAPSMLLLHSFSFTSINIILLFVAGTLITADSSQSRTEKS